MSLSSTIKAQGALNQLKWRLVDITFDSSYPTGGEAMSGVLAGIGLSSLLALIDASIGATTALKFRYDATNNKLLVLRAGPAEYTYSEGDIKGSANTDAVGAGAYVTIPTNGNLISTLAAADNTTAFTIALQPDIARNICILIKDATGGSVDGNAADYAIVGTFRGAAQTETISFSAANVATMANGNIAAKYGSKPFDSITSITPSAAQPTGFQHGVGPGSKLGLPVSTDTNAEADILKLFKNAADLAKTGLYSTNETVNFGTLADGDDVSVVYRISGGEVQNTATLASLTARFFMLGT